MEVTRLPQDVDRIVVLGRARLIPGDGMSRPVETWNGPSDNGRKEVLNELK